MNEFRYRTRGYRWCGEAIDSRTEAFAAEPPNVALTQLLFGFCQQGPNIDKHLAVVEK